MSIKYDFSLPNNQPIGIGNSLYLLGTSIDGPVYEPIQITSVEQAISIFGDRNQGTLVKSFEQAYDINNEISIFLMRITGKSATLKIEGFHESKFGNYLSFRSAYAGSKYNDTLVKVEYRESTNEMALILESSDGNFVYNLEDYISLRHLVQTINSHYRAGHHKIIAQTDFGSLNSMSFLNSYTEDRNFEGGEDGVIVSKDDLYIAMDTAYNLLLGKPIDVIVPCGMYVDDVHPTSLYGSSSYGSAVYASNRDYLQLVDTLDNNRVVSYHEQLIDFCRNQMSLGYMTHGIIGIRPLDHIPDSIEYDHSYLVQLVETTVFKDRYGMSEFKDGQWSDKGFYITVFGSEVVFNESTPNEYYDNGAVTYAALLAGHFDTTTNLKIPGNLKLRYELSDEVLSDLSVLGVVTYRNSIRRGLVVNDGVTAAHHTSDLHDVANVRMIQLTLAHVNNAVEVVYQSELDPAVRRRVVEDLVRERLEDLEDMGVLTGYDYNIVLTQDQSSGVIQLRLHTKYTIEGVGTSAQITNLGA